MNKLDNFIELNSLEKQNGRNRLEDKLRQEYDGEIKELFDPLTKFLYAHNEQNLALGEQTLRATDWQNQGLDKLKLSRKLVLRSVKLLRRCRKPVPKCIMYSTLQPSLKDQQLHYMDTDIFVLNFSEGNVDNEHMDLSNLEPPVKTNKSSR